MPSSIPSTVTDMTLMFYATSAFNQDISGWIMGAVTSTVNMFNNAGAFNQPIGLWDVSSVASMAGMLRNADAFDQDISAWDFTGLDGVDGLNSFIAFTPGLSTTNYDALLIAWSDAADAGFLTLAFTPDMGNSTFTTGGAGETARTNLVNTHLWTIADAGGV